MIPNLVEVYCLASDLTKKIDENIKKNPAGRKGTLSRAEYLTIAIIKQERCIQTNKDLYELIKDCMKAEFPKLPSYQQFCEGLEGNFMYLAIMGQILAQMNKSTEENEYIVDSSALPICKTMYSNNERLANGIADFGKNLEGWFFGFKIHLIINTSMEIVSFRFSPASTSDISVLDQKMVHGLRGYLVGDKGYLSAKKTAELFENGLHLITRTRKNMKKPPVQQHILSLLSKRQRIETVFGQLKNNFILICKRARSVQSFFAHACAALVAYMIKKKPDLLSLDFDLFSSLSIS